VAAVIDLEDFTCLTPIETEKALDWAKNESGRAWRILKDARNAEVKAKKVYRIARTEALLGGECPRVGRDGVTVAERDAWVDRQTEDELSAYEAAKVMTENAADYLKTVREQGSLIQSQHKSVMQAYQMAGVGER
jgi:antirestriction protein ArdC